MYTELGRSVYQESFTSREIVPKTCLYSNREHFEIRSPFKPEI